MLEPLSWLPAELRPVAMRIARASECAYAIGRIAGEWSFNGPVEIEQVSLEGGRYAARIRSIRPIPPRVLLLFSEAINHLRAALDNTIWHLVGTEQEVPAKAATSVSMPIHGTEESFDEWINPRVKKGLTAFGPNSSLSRRVRSVQPFVDQTSSIHDSGEDTTKLTGTPVEEGHPLTLLQAYSNQDKHRSIRLATAQGMGGDTRQEWTETRPFIALEAGNTLYEGVLGQPVEYTLATAILIARPAPFAAFVSPANEISQLASYVARTALPQLVTGLSLPTALPLGVDLDDSGLTELERLQQGDHRSAQEQLAAWSVEKFLAADARPPRPPHFGMDGTDAGGDSPGS